VPHRDDLDTVEDDQSILQARAVLVNNERLKITATWISNLGTAIFAVGGFGPIISFSYGVFPAIAIPTVVGTSATCLGVAVIIHLASRWILKGLK
jgi:hypothetical protein